MRFPAKVAAGVAAWGAVNFAAFKLLDSRLQLLHDMRMGRKVSAPQAELKALLERESCTLADLWYSTLAANPGKSEALVSADTVRLALAAARARTGSHRHAHVRTRTRTRTHTPQAQAHAHSPRTPHRTARRACR